VRSREADRWKALERYFETITTHLKVNHWDIVVLHDASDIDAHADITCNSQSDYATLRVAHDFWRLDPAKQREVLVHEALHIVTCRADQASEALEEALGKVAWAVYSPILDDAHERVVDHVARIIADSLPLPALPKA
jgi:hypothetical protein